jgi:hypothetical protein
MQRVLSTLALALCVGVAGSVRADEAGQGETDRSPLDGVQGHWGLGYFTTVAPLGMRYWFDKTSGLDIGLDANLSGAGGTSSYRFGGEAGYVRSLGHYHYCVPFWRVGAGISFDDGFSSAGTKITKMLLDGLIGAELFFGAQGFPNVSLQLGYGLQVTLSEPGSDYLIATNNAGIKAVSVGSLGFHIYL